ncbi:MAG: FixH family protein [candidate division Zixibacteria bacterium]|nr:FixH family protein [candidate division Zixibacteria bacterium]
MIGWKDFSVEILTEHPFLVALAAVALIAMTWWLYRRTNPPISVWIRASLVALRLVAVLALILALSQPIISYTREYERPRRISLLLDRSLSMEKEESGRTRIARMDSLLTDQIFRRVTQDAEVTSYYLGGNLVSDASQVMTNQTALGDVLHQLDRLQVERRDDWWLLFSDGNSNAGRSPAEVATTMRTPIVTIDMTSGAGSFDLGINDIEFNPIVFVGRPTEVVVKFGWQDGLGRKIRLELMDSSRVLDATEFEIVQDGGLGEVTLKFIPTSPGRRLMSVRVPPLTGEETVDNNSRSFSMKILKSRLLVLMVSESPDHELGFLRRFFEQSDRFDAELIVTGSKAGNLAGRFPSRQTELNRYDLVVLHDPDPDQLENRAGIIKSYLEDRGGAIWVLMGSRYAARGPCEWFDSLLPFHPTSRQELRYLDYHGEPQEDQLYHPAVRLADDPSSIRETWSSLPPFQKLVPCDRLAPNAVVLVRGSIRTRLGQLPILGYRRFGPGKLLAQAALPFWTWGFTTLGLGQDGMTYNRFVDGVASWLTVVDDLAPIRIGPEKRVFTRGEPVRFDGYAFDPGFRPIDGATGSVELRPTDKSEPFVQDLIERRDGEYRAVFDHLVPGKYSYRAVIEQDGRILKADDGEILIESFSIEEFDRSGRPSELAAIARLSGGNYFTFEEFDQVIGMLDLTSVAEREDEDITFFNKLWLLLTIVGALSLEWLIRKMNQLV